MKDFCFEIRKVSSKKCSWEDYYAILDDIRYQYDGFFDPGAKRQIDIKEIYDEHLPKKLIGASGEDSCDLIINPSPADFYKLVKASRPTIIKKGAEVWPALGEWTLKNLRQKWSDKKVVVSISPTGDFDGPEDASLWGLNATESVVIARPAHAQMTFANFIDASKESRLKNVTHYLEYFPLKSLLNPGSKDVLNIKWANFLSPRFTLVWFGMSGQRNPVGRLHYDRHENLMAVVAGSKQFVLYGPDQGEELYAATPVRSGALSYYPFARNVSSSFDYTGTNSEKIGTFVRDKSSIDETFNEYHTYSPVDILNPDFSKYPKFQKAKKKVCNVEKGDIIYVPADWWHQVTSLMDEEGKNIGINIFYEPFYKKPGYLTLMKKFVRNRYYSHLHDLEFARPCGSDKICFSRRGSAKEASTQELRYNRQGDRKKRRRRMKQKSKQ